MSQGIYIIRNGELYHHGVKDQRWGIRRYQNEDGSLTELGKKRYLKGGTLDRKKYDKDRKKWDKEDRKEDAKRRAEERKNSRTETDEKSGKAGNKASDTLFAEKLRKEEADEIKDLENEKKLESLKPKEKSGLEKTKDLVDSTVDTTRSIRNLERLIPEKKTRVQLDLSNMSEKQMREEINRAMLERQYNDMFNPAVKSKGRERARTALEVGGAVLAVGSTALSIALAIKELSGK